MASDRLYVSRYSQPGFGLRVYRDGAPGDADALPTVRLLKDGEDEPLWARPATRTGPGTYTVTLTSGETSAAMAATLEWLYTVNQQAQVYAVEIEVGPSNPAYDALPPAWQDIVEQTWIKFDDLFDSPFGGPNLQVYLQTKFGRNRLAQLLPSALQRLNSASAPHASYPLGSQAFPFDAWSGLLIDALYIETVTHLIRSYTEIPEAVLATAVSRMDRRDYMQRWTDILNIAQPGFERDLKRYRQANLGLGHVSVLVAGGAYGNFGPEINPGGVGAAAARGYVWSSGWH